jgi:hypothetical protein
MLGISAVLTQGVACRKHPLLLLLLPLPPCRGAHLCGNCRGMSDSRAGAVAAAGGALAGGQRLVWAALVQSLP